MVVATTSRMLRMRRALKSTNGATSRWVVDSGTTVHRISDGEAELAGMVRIPVPTAVSFTAANRTTYSAHYAKLTLPGTNISLSTAMLEASPNLPSVCQLSLHEGFGFLSMPAKTPVLILPDMGKSLSV